MPDYSYRPVVGWHDYSESEREQRAITNQLEHENPTLERAADQADRHYREMTDATDDAWPHATETNRGAW
jgi:hypothetical protein